MVYGILELGLVVIIVTAPFWAGGLVRWMTRPFGVAPDKDRKETGD
jgi:hypothetical protein